MCNVHTILLKNRLLGLIFSYDILDTEFIDNQSGVAGGDANVYLHSPRPIMGTNLVLGPSEKFYRRNPSGTFSDVHWYHLGDPKKVPGAPSQGFLIFLGFDKNITKIENWLSYPHFWADFQVSYHFGKLLTARLQR